MKFLLILFISKYSLVQFSIIQVHKIIILIKNMKKRNLKEATTTSRDRHLKWINFYGSKNFGIYVECTKCKKWRRTYQYRESHEVPEHWHCSMLNKGNDKEVSCKDPEETNGNFLEYYPASVVWAKLPGYPWWPAMVDGCPDTDEYERTVNNTVSYNVTFLDKKPSHAWIKEKFICSFSKTPKPGKVYHDKLLQNKCAKAKERAEAAMKMTIRERLQTYSFVHSYKGPWPVSPNLEEPNYENTGKTVDFFEKPTNTEKETSFLSDDTIDVGNNYSKFGCTETSSAVFVPKEYDNKIVHGAQEKSLAKCNKNVSPEVSNYKNLNTQNKAKNVSLTDKVTNTDINISSKKSIQFSCLSSEDVLSIQNEPIDNIKHSNYKGDMLKEKIAYFSQKVPETRVLQNQIKSSSKISKHVRFEINKLTKKSPAQIKPVEYNRNNLPKEIKTLFSSFTNNNSHQNNEIAVDKNTTYNEKKILEPMLPGKITILL